ncbi:MAG: glycosyltransferase family 4 protein [Candidatus Hodarchaeota archaeon]
MDKSLWRWKKWHADCKHNRISLESIGTVKVTFISHAQPSLFAFHHRMKKLAEGLCRLNVKTNFLYLKEYPFKGPSLLQPLNLPFIREKLRDSDFIHAGNVLSTLCLGFLLPMKHQTIICDLHGDVVSEAKLKIKFHYSLINLFNLFQAKIADHFAIRFSDYFLAVCEPLKQSYVTKGVPRDKLWVIRNGVDTTLFDFQKPKKFNELVITYAGGFQVWQGIGNLLRAVELISKRSKIKLKIIGLNSTQTELRKRLMKRLQDKVILVDRMPQEELIPHLKNSSFFIIPRDKHPAVYHAFPTKFAEYLSIGRPIIVTDVDETADFVRTYKCGIVTRSNPESIAEGIERASELSSNEICAMGRNARSLAVQQFDWKIISKQYLNYLKQVS